MPPRTFFYVCARRYQPSNLKEIVFAVQKFAYERHRKPYLHFGRKSYCERAPRAPADPVTKRSRWRCSTAARPAHGACCGPETGAAGLMAAMKAATCGSTFAHTHRDSGIRCSSSQKSAGPAGRQLLREARAAPGRAPAVLLSSLRASNCASFVSQSQCSSKLTGC